MAAVRVRPQRLFPASARHGKQFRLVRRLRPPSGRRRLGGLSHDRHGWGQSPGRRGHLASYRDFVEDASGLAAWIRNRHGGLSLHLAGMSWGGLAALYLAFRRGWLFDSLSLLAPGLVCRRDLGRGGRLAATAALLAGRSGHMVKTAFRPGDFTSNPDWLGFVAGDPDRVRRVEASFCLETLKMRRFVRETAGRRRLPPGLCLLAGEDRIVDNRETARLCVQAGLAVKTIPGAAHSLIFEQPELTAAQLILQAETALGAAPAKPSGQAVDSGGAGGVNPADRRPVWVVGGGAVGGSLAALLGFGGVSAGVLTKPGRAAQLNREGFCLVSGRGERLALGNPRWSESPDELPPRPRLVILAVKGFDSAAALATLADRLPEDAVLATLQNGLGNEELLAAAFPRHSLVSAVLCAGLETIRPGLVSWPSDRGGIGAALWQGDADLAREAWQDSLLATGLECRWFSSPGAARRLKWSKLMLNAGFNALNALSGLSSHELIRHPVHGRLVLQAMREGLRVMRALGLAPLDLPGYPVRQLGRLLRAPLPLARRLLAWNLRPGPEAAFSLRQDFLAGRTSSEIDGLNGAIVNQARELGLAAPVNEDLWKGVREWQARVAKKNGGRRAGAGLP